MEKLSKEQLYQLKMKLFNGISAESEIVFVITLEHSLLDDLEYPEVVAVFKEFDLVEKYLKEHNVISVGHILTSDKNAENKDISFIEDIYEVSVFNLNTGKQIT